VFHDCVYIYRYIHTTTLCYIQHTHFLYGPRIVEKECMACLWTNKYVNKCAFRSHFNRRTTGGVTETYCCTIPYHLPTPNTLLSTQTDKVVPAPNMQVSCRRLSMGLWWTHSGFVSESLQCGQDGSWKTKGVWDVITRDKPEWIWVLWDCENLALRFAVLGFS